MIKSYNDELTVIRFVSYSRNSSISPLLSLHLYWAEFFNFPGSEAEISQMNPVHTCPSCFAEESWWPLISKNLT